MKINLLYMLMLILATSCLDKKTTEYSLIPMPQEVYQLRGAFKLNEQTVIISEDKNNATANYLASFIRQSTGFAIPLKKYFNKATPVIQLVQDTSMHQLKTEGYYLKVRKKRITITAATETGLFYGCQTLLQLLPIAIYSNRVVDTSWTIPCVKIKDIPTFEWRGLMIDMARHFFGIEFLKKIINQMALLKLNRLHLHLSDNEGWRIEIPKYPKLTKIGAIGSYSNPEAKAQFLSYEEANELVQYAKRHHITIVPEMDMPGHSGALTRAYPELSGGHNTINVSSQKTLTTVQEILAEIIQIFHSPYMHQGGDEVRQHEWHKRDDMKQKLKKLQLNNVKELEGWYDRTIASFILSNNKIPVCWDEASDFDIDNRAIVQWWRCLQPGKLIEAIQKGHQVIVSPPDFVYFDYPYAEGEFGAHWEGMRNGGNSIELIYHWMPIPDSLSEQEKKQIIGLEACVWTEFIQTEKRLEYMIFPRILAFAEQTWTKKEQMDFMHFKKRMNAHLNRYALQGINYRIPDLSVEKRKLKQPEAFR
jgi:hexosaminidase